jgi:hypothetical protein
MDPSFYRSHSLARVVVLDLCVLNVEYAIFVSDINCAYIRNAVHFAKYN